METLWIKNMRGHSCARMRTLLLLCLVGLAMLGCGSSDTPEPAAEISVLYTADTRGVLAPCNT